MYEIYVQPFPAGPGRYQPSTDGGDFYEDGELLAGGEFEVDVEQGSFQVELDIPRLDLGPVELSDVLVDIRHDDLRITRLVGSHGAHGLPTLPSHL